MHPFIPGLGAIGAYPWSDRERQFSSLAKECSLCPLAPMRALMQKEE